MTDETNELMERARALLAAATQGEWAQCMEESPDGCYGISPPNPTSERGREQARHDAALIAFAVNNLPAMLDAIDAENQRAENAERRCRELADCAADASDSYTRANVRADEAEACAAAMREALAMHAEVRRAEHHGELHATGASNGCRCRWCLTGRALDSNPGTALLARMHAAEADAAALPAMDAECARLRAQVDADRQTIVRMTDDRDRAMAAAESSEEAAKGAANLLAKVGENAYAWPYGVAWACKEAHRLLTGGPPDGVYVRAPADKPRDLDAEVVAGVQASRTTPEPKP